MQNTIQYNTKITVLQFILIFQKSFENNLRIFQEELINYTYR